MTVNEQVAELLQQSQAVHVDDVRADGEERAGRRDTTHAGQAAAVAGMGAGKSTAMGSQLGLSTTMLDGHVMVGGMVSTTVTVWLHVAVLVQQSMACQVRVMFHGHRPLVTVLTTAMVTLVPQQTSEAVGRSNDQFEPHWTVLLAAQVMTGGMVSTTRSPSGCTSRCWCSSRSPSRSG